MKLCEITQNKIQPKIHMTSMSKYMLPYREKYHFDLKIEFREFMSSNEDIEFIKKFVTEVWVNRDSSKVEQYYDKDFVGILNGEETFDLADVFKRIEYSQNKFEKNEVEFLDIFTITTGLIGAKINMHRIDTNKEKKIPILLVIKTANNKISRLWLFTDLNYRYKNWDT